MAIRVPDHADTLRDQALSEIQDRVLWLSMQMIHHANNVRPNADGSKVGGHQASSASVVTVMTSLYFDFMRAGDRIAIKPHASPVFHAIKFLLGELDQGYLKQLRAFHGLQSYPSRTKDPDGVDFSTGSVGIGAVAPNFAALVDEYTRTHVGARTGPGRRYISLVGDAELDEGSVWEAIAEPTMSGLSNLLWVVDLNRQSLDRIIPGIRVKSWRAMFGAMGWNVIDAKYGTRLEAAFAEPDGELLRECIDDMSNEAYQRLLRLSPATLREWMPRYSRKPDALKRFISKWDDRELQDLFRNLGGHDFATLRKALREADAKPGPHVIFAYTMKGWMLPSIGDPQNHSVLLSSSQMEELRTALGIPENQVWAGFEPNTPAGRLCAEARVQLGVVEKAGATSPPVPLSEFGEGGPKSRVGAKEIMPSTTYRPSKSTSPLSPPSPNSERGTGGEVAIPPDFNHPYGGRMSTQEIFGLVLTAISRNLPEVSRRVVTVSPDVASSTNLGGWINKVGVWSRFDKGPMPEEEIVRALRWEETPQGQHIELGISENNLFMALGQLGLAHEMHGELLFPIGALYDCFVRRGLDAFLYSVYSGGRFIVVGTPSGITLAPEGGAHQSLLTPSIGAEMPELAFYEPCFGQELEWIMLHALEQIRLRKESTYLRLTSKRVDQSLFAMPKDAEGRERLRQQVLKGAYRLVDRRGERGYHPGGNVVHVMVSGAMVPEAIEASKRLLEEGVMANVIVVTGPGPLYRRFQDGVRAAARSRPGLEKFMSDVVPGPDRKAPLVTLVDGHPHSLAWLGSALNAPTLPLGVTAFGQSGSRADLYREYEIGVDSIMAACFGALELMGSGDSNVR
jgi:pyruvate dehydrogenase E1 component